MNMYVISGVFIAGVILIYTALNAVITTQIFYILGTILLLGGAINVLE